MDRTLALQAALVFQTLLIMNGARIEAIPGPAPFGYEPKNIFRSADGSQIRFR